MLRYIVEGETCGPVSEEDLKALLEKGEITGDTLVGKDGWSFFQPLNGQDFYKQMTEPEAPAAAGGMNPMLIGGILLIVIVGILAIVYLT